MTDTTPMTGSEIAARVKKLPPHQQRAVSHFIRALVAEQAIENARLSPASRAAVRMRLLSIEEMISGVRLRRERGLARRGALREEGLATVDSLCGIAPHWVLTGDIEALASRIRVYANGG